MAAASKRSEVQFAADTAWVGRWTGEEAPLMMRGVVVWGVGREIELIMCLKKIERLNGWMRCLFVCGWSRMKAANVA